MKNYIRTVFIFSLLLLITNCQPQKKTSCPAPTMDRIKGLSLVGEPDSFSYDPMPNIQALSVNWVAVIPYAFTRPNEASVQYNVRDWQWWGERPIGVRTTIRTAQSANAKVMLKPQLWVPGSWVGELNLKTDEKWTQWEADYEKYILLMARIAQEEGVELFCIGTEFEIHALRRPYFWRQLIPKIRNIYAGKLTYAANWDKFERVTFWGQLDYIGIDAYFPLSKAKTPSISTLQQKWQKHVRKIENLYCQLNKPILFTEFGYLSVDGTAFNTWELEARLQSIPTNEQAQVNALEALFETFWEKDWWAGGFLWKWYPNEVGHEGNFVKGYTPQGKMAEGCLKKWYGR